ncbi:Asd/ArgC dimerization domain-containing protein [uncultured Deefgea sp.]|uniref:Asd/ArgC dimerization domain-containing protein n=1 Tax=uncultured Deefgea sp. TaxID=1304914 RepID=UPI00261DB9F5|nr:Asd/ArgC dimerization domain-containing protein [uncultured Deefgea sp.]
MSEAIAVALVGADTPASQAFLDVLGEMPLALTALYPLSDDEEAVSVELRHQSLPMIDVASFDWKKADAVVFVGAPELAKRYAQAACDAGAAVIDLTGATASQSGKPQRGHIVGLPHVLTSMISAPLAALHALGAIDFAGATAMLSVSEDGQAAIEALSMQTRQLFAQQEVELAGYPKRLAFNLLPTADCGEEQRIATELTAVGTPLNCITVSRVPMFFGHAVSLNVLMHDGVTLEQIEAAIQASPALYYLKADGAAGIATPQDAIGGDKIWLNQLQVAADGRSVQMWLVADNARLPARAAVLLLALL